MDEIIIVPQKLDQINISDIIINSTGYRVSPMYNFLFIFIILIICYLCYYYPEREHSNTQSYIDIILLVSVLHLKELVYILAFGYLNRLMDGGVCKGYSVIISLP